MSVLEDLAEQLREEHHAEEAEALIIVDQLMRQYAFYRLSMDEGTEKFSARTSGNSSLNGSGVDIERGRQLRGRPQV
jgi:hypothetical protein